MTVNSETPATKEPDVQRSASASAETRAPVTTCRNVLFLCPDNSCASIFAEAILRNCARGSFQAFSAGSKPIAEIHPLTVNVLKSQRVWRPELKTKGCEEFLGQDSPKMDFIISLGERAPEGLPPRWPGNPRVMHWRISEPIVDGQGTEKLHMFRKTFGELDTRIRLFTLVNTRQTFKRAAA